MNDTYIELLVKKPDSKTATLLHNFMIGVGAVLFLGGIIVHWIFVFVGILFLIGSVFPTINNDVEYEYLLLDKELSIDKIKKQEKRKHVASYKLESVTLAAPKGSDRMLRFDTLKTVDYSSDTEEGNPYEIVVEGDGQKVRICIDTIPEMVAVLHHISPRNVYND